MKQLVMLVLCTTLSASVQSQNSILNQGTLVTVILDENLNSGISQSGDKVNFIVADDIMVGDKIAIRKGARAWGQILEAKRSKMVGKKGKLDFSVDYAEMTDGRNVKLRSQIDRSGKGRMGGVIVAAAILNPIALFIKGKNISINKGESFIVYVDENIGIE